MPHWSACSRNNWRRSKSRFDSLTNSVCPLTQKRPSRSLFWRMKHGTGGRRMCPLLRERRDRRCWGRSHMHESGIGRRASGIRGRHSWRCRLRGQDARETAGRWPALRSTLKILLILSLALLFPLLSCSNRPDSDTLVMIIESSPTNLDPRVGIDAFSERIDSLIFDDLLSRGNDLNVAPGLAERWDIPDPVTYVFHLHRGVNFHDGRPLTSDRKST